MSHQKIKSNEADLACIGASAAVSTCVCVPPKMMDVYLCA